MLEFEYITEAELLISGTWTSILDDIISSNGIQLVPRIDGTFLVGTFDAELSREFIPAYTPLKITYKSNTYYFVCSSTGSKYLFEENKYYHTFNIFEATAILCNFIVGTKGFSVKGTNRTDSEKVTILIDLMEDKYGLDITNEIPTLSNEREFTFGAGTTLFDALSAILADYDLIPIVTLITSPTEFTIEVLDKTQVETIDYSDSELTSVVNKQDMDNYCNYLETEATGVVDRTTTVKWKNLTVRSEDAIIKADTCCIVLPNRVEQIKDIRTTIKFDFEVFIPNDDNGNLIDQNFIYKTSASSGVVRSSYNGINQGFDSIFYYLMEYIPHEDDEQSVIEWYEEQTILYKTLKELFENIYGRTFSHSELVNELNSHVWSSGTTSGFWTVIEYEGRYQFSLESVVFNNMTLKTNLLEKSVWDTKTLDEKPKYMYYESGSNVIRGLYTFYDDSLWGNITGNNTGPFYKEISYKTTGDYIYGEYHSHFTDFNLLDALFDIEAVTINDPMIINEKSIPTMTGSESAWKPYARSYNVSANTIEFDKLEERMQLTNDMLGDVELEIEMSNPSYLPLITSKKAYKLTYNDVEYYVMAYVINIKLDMVTIKYSLSRTYSKKASVIGVDSQFEATPNPLKNIITRPIYINAATGTRNTNLDLHNLLQFIFTDVNDNIKILYKRYSVLEHGTTKILYCETIDQYTFDYKMKKIGDITNQYQRDIIPYVDENNEFKSVTISLVQINNIDSTISKKLPNFNGTIANEVTLASNVVIYKDASEHLTFTIKLN